MKKVFIHSIVSLFILGVFFTGHYAFAEVSNALTADQQTWLGTKIQSGFNALLQAVALGILNLFAWLVAMTGLLLNYAVSTLVIGMGDQVLNKGFGAPINQLWTIIRDLVNITFIFSLIYIGITTILNGGSSGAKKLLGSVIISALMVNFSLFFAKAIIDVGNFVATSVYSQMVATPTATSLSQSGISGAFMQKLGVTPLLTQGGQGSQTGIQNMLEKAMKPENGGNTFILVYTVGASILLFQLAFAFGFGAFMLIVRFVVLIMLMIFSPVAFLPSVLPGFSSYKKQWWDALISQTFMAPVLLFGLYLTYLIIASVSGSLGTGGLGTGIGDGGTGLLAAFDETKASAPTTISLLLFYIVAVILLISVTAMAKKMGSAGAGFASSASGYVEKKLKGALTTTFMAPARGARLAVTKPAGWLAKNAVGAASKKFARIDTNLKSSKTGRFIRGAATVATFGAIDDVDRQALYEKGLKVKFGNARSYKEAADIQSAREKEEKQREKEEKGLAEVQKKGAAPFDKTIHKDIVDLIKSIRDLKQGELENKSMSELTNPDIAMHLTSTQMESIKTSTKFSQSEKDAIKKAREDGLMKAVSYTNPTTGGISSDLSLLFHDRTSAEIATLPSKVLATPEIAWQLSSKQMDTIESDTSRPDAEKENIRVARRNSMVQQINRGYADRLLGKLNPSEIAKLPSEVLEHTGTTPYHTVQSLKALARDNPNRTNLKKIGDNIGATGTGATPGVISWMGSGDRDAALYK